MTARNYAIAGAVAAAVLAAFATLAQLQIILVPYLTPAVLEIQGLKDAYSVNDRATFDITVKGYGSNCHLLQVEATNQAGERASYYKKADDCRFMAITYGPYNFTRSFEYGSEVLAQGVYKLDVQFEDLKGGGRVSTTRSFNVNAQ